MLTLAAPLWLPSVGLALIVTDPLEPADAIVPLAGDLGQRVSAAAALFQEGYAPHLIVTDIEHATNGTLCSKDQAEHAIVAGVPATQIISIDRIVRSTYTELQAIRDLAQAHNWRSLIVVTSPQHTRRTRLVADKVFHNTSIAVSVQPVVGYGYEPAEWWRNKEERGLTLMEYPKILAFLLGYRG